MFHIIKLCQKINPFEAIEIIARFPDCKPMSLGKLDYCGHYIIDNILIRLFRRSQFYHRFDSKRIGYAIYRVKTDTMAIFNF